MRPDQDSAGTVLVGRSVGADAGAVGAVGRMRSALNDRQIARMVFRIALFKRRGLTESHAEAWADLLADRDADGDERRICLECTGLQQDGGCFPAKQGWLPRTSPTHHPIKTLFQRCERFEFVTP